MTPLLESYNTTELKPKNAISCLNQRMNSCDIVHARMCIKDVISRQRRLNNYNTVVGMGGRLIGPI